MHPCGVLLSDHTLLDRTPVEASHAGFPMSQFDKDDVEELGLLKLDVLGVRMQSAMAHAITETKRVTGELIEPDTSSPISTRPGSSGVLPQAISAACCEVTVPFALRMSAALRIDRRRSGLAARI